MRCRLTAKSALLREWTTISASRSRRPNFKQRWNAGNWRFKIRSLGGVTFASVFIRWPNQTALSIAPESHLPKHLDVTRLAPLVSVSGGDFADTRERGGQIVDSRRLAQVIIHSCCKTFFAITFHGVGGQGNDANAWF